MIRRLCKIIFYYFMRALTSAFGLAIINTVYLLAGALIFNLIEAPNESEVIQFLKDDRHKLVNELHVIVDFTKSAAATFEYETEAIGKALNKYETALANFWRKRAAGRNKDTNKTESTKLWTMSGAVVYAFSVVTTIGWGNIVPTTRFGRAATIFYGFVGIPLVFTLSSEVGSFTTKIVRLLSYIIVRIFCGPSVEDKTMNRPLKQSEDAALDTAIRLDTTSALNSGYNHYPQNAKSPPSSTTNFVKLAHSTPDMKDFHKDEEFVSQVTNNNSSYLKSLDSTMDFLLEISRDPSIWGDGKENKGLRENTVPGKRHSRQAFGRGDFFDLLSKPRYRLRTVEDAEMLSTQLGRLPLEDFCRIMKLVGFSFEDEILRQEYQGSSSSSSDFEVTLSKTSTNMPSACEQKRQKNTVIKNDGFDAGERIIETRQEVEDMPGEHPEKQKYSPVKSTVCAPKSYTLSVENEYVEVKKHRRTLTRNNELHVKGDFFDRQVAASGEQDFSEKLDHLEEEKGKFQSDDHMLGGGDKAFQEKNDDVPSMINEGVEDSSGFNFSTLSAMVGGGDNTNFYDRLQPVANTDEIVKTTENIPLHHEQFQNCGSFSGGLRPNLFRSEEDLSQRSRKTGSVFGDPRTKEGKERRSPTMHQMDSASALPDTDVVVPPLAEDFTKLMNFKPSLIDKKSEVTRENFYDIRGGLHDRNSQGFPLSESGWTNYFSGKSCAESKPFRFSYCNNRQQKALKNVSRRKTMMKWKQKQFKRFSNSPKILKLSLFPRPIKLELKTKRHHKLTNEYATPSACHAPHRISYLCAKTALRVTSDEKEKDCQCTAVSFERLEPPDEIKIKDAFFENSHVQNDSNIQLDVGSPTSTPGFRENVAAVDTTLKSSGLISNDLNCAGKEGSCAILETSQSFETSTNIPISHTPPEIQPDHYLAYREEESSTCVPYETAKCESKFLQASKRPHLVDIKKPANKERQMSNILENEKTSTFKEIETNELSRPKNDVMHEKVKGLEKLWTDNCQDRDNFEGPTNSQVKAELMDRYLTGSKDLKTYFDTHELKQRNRLLTAGAMNTIPCVKNRNSKTTGRETIDQFVSVCNAVEICVSPKEQSECVDSKTTTHASCTTLGKASKPLRSFGLGILAEGDALHLDDSRLETGSLELTKEYKVPAVASTHRNKRLARCVQWVEQSYPFICERERRRKENMINLKKKRLKTQIDPRKSKTQHFCKTNFSDQSKDYPYESAKADNLSPKLYRTNLIRARRTNRRTYTMFWLGEHNMLGYSKEKTHTAECNRQNSLLSFHDLEEREDNVNVNTEQQVSSLVAVQKNSKKSESSLNSLPDDTVSTNVKQYDDCKKPLDQNFNKKEKGKKDKKGGRKGSKSSKKGGKGSKKGGKGGKKGSKGGKKGGKGGKKGSISSKKSGKGSKKGGKGNKKGGKGNKRGSQSGKGDKGKGKGKSRPKEDKRKPPGRDPRRDRRSDPRSSSSKRGGRSPARVMKRKTTKGGGRLGSVRVKKRKSMRSVERRPHRRDRAPRSSDGQSSRSEDDPKRALRDERDREAHAEKHHRPHHHRKHEHSKKKRGQSPALLGLFNIRSKKPRRDRWAEYRPKDNRTLQEDLAVLKAAIGESTVAQPQDEEDVEVPLIFVYFGMCMFMVLGGLMNFKINPDITYVDGSIYFVYVLCSTIGFGDILPDEEYYWFHLIYGLTGVSMFNITVNATLQYMMATLDYLKVVVSKP